MRINANGQFLLGTTTSRGKLTIAVDSSSADGLYLDNANGGATMDLALLGSGYNAHGANAGEIWFYSPDNINIGGATGNTNSIKSLGGGSERMRIDSSGNFLVGTTSTIPFTFSSGTGAGITSSGTLMAGATAEAGLFNRVGSDGNVVNFYKAGSIVGSIITQGGNLIMASGSVGVGVGSDNLYPTNGSGASSDNAMDVGDASARFDDVYATNGTIQTSDRNEKQDIEELSDAEQRVAVVAKGLMRKFRWIDSVAEKGDNARTHFGIIAQDRQDAFTAEGLDAGDYAMVISDTWTNDDGNEQTRLGVRYNQLLAFIISAI